MLLIQKKFLCNVLFLPGCFLWLCANITVKGYQGTFCNRPQPIRFGAVNTLPNMFGRRYKTGTVIALSCMSGYVLRGSATARCDDRKWIISSDNGLPACIRDASTPICRGRCTVSNSVCALLKGRSVCICQPGFTEVLGSCQARSSMLVTPGLCRGLCIPNSSCVRLHTNQLACVCKPGFHVMAKRCIEGFSHEKNRATTLSPSSPPTTTNSAFVMCYVPLGPSNGYVLPRNKVHFYVGEVVSFQCYPPLRLSGEKNTMCLETGYFAAVNPSCEADPLPTPLIVIPCSRPSPPMNGRIIGDPQKQVWQVGEKLQYGCVHPELGILYRVAEVFCSPDGIFTGDPPVCVVSPTSSINPFPVTCLRLPTPVNGEIIGDPYKEIWEVGERIFFYCFSGFDLLGNEFMECLPDGVFGGEIPVCRAMTSPKRQCTVSPPSGGIVVGSVTSIEAGEKVEYMCESGKTLIGRSRLQCQFDGTLSSTPPVCTLCIPTAPNNGYLYPQEKNTWAANDLIMYRCNKGFTLVGFATSYCQSDGKIIGDIPTCVEGNVEVEICTVPQPLNGYSRPNGTNKYENGVVFEFACQDGFAIQGYAINICLDGELAIEVPQCVATS